MSLQLIEPGKRKNNKTWIFRGFVGGKLREITTDFPANTAKRTLREAAAAAERGIWAEIEARRVPRPREITTFKQATNQYLNFRDHEKKLSQYRQNIERLLPHLGERPLATITAADIHDLATQLYPHVKASSRNSMVIVPAAAIIHYAAKNQWCPDIRIPQFKIPKPRNRDVSDEQAEMLINSLPSDASHYHEKRLLLLWLFRQGDRIGDVLTIRWEQLDLVRRSVRSWIEKADEERTRFLHEEVFEALAAVPINARRDYVFPWRHRTSVYLWLEPYSKKLGFYFRPHMARHTVGRQLNAAGVPLKTAAEVLGHKDPRSTLRYQSADEDSVRRALSKLGK